MKKILAMIALVLTVVAMAACSGGAISFEDIEISGYKTEFVVGDTFDKGGLVVTAVFTDDSTKDVTADAQVSGPAALDKAGAYVVKVVYGEVEKLYQINVKDLPNATYENVNAAVEAAVANAEKIASGTVVVNQYGDNVIEYTFGENHVVINRVSDETVYQYEDLGDDVYFGFNYYEYDGVKEFYNVEEITAEHFAGPEVYNVIDGFYFYGAEGLLNGLYALANEAGQDLEENVVACDVCGDQTFTYSFGYLNVDYGCYYLIEVEFALNRNGVLTNLQVESKKYNETYEAWGETLYSYTVDEETGYVTLDTYADYATEVTVEYNQVEGERNAVNEYTYDSVMYTSFDLVDFEGNPAPTVYNVQAGDTVSFEIANALPATAVAGLNSANFECDLFGYWGSVYDNVVSIDVYSAGTYNITMTYGNVVKEFVIIAAEPQPQFVSSYASEYVEGWFGAGYEMMETSVATVEVDGVLYVGAAVYPEQASQDLTITLKEAYTGAELAEVAYDDWNAPYFDGQMLQFVAKEVGTYVVVFTSNVDNTITAELVVTVVEASSTNPDEEETGSIIGTWTAIHPKTGMAAATIEFFDGVYAQFSAGMIMGMIGYTLDGTTLEFQIPAMLAGTIALEDVVMNAELTEFTATVILNGEPMPLTFTKGE